MPPSPNPVDIGCAQRLLEAMHPVCSHDLPNQAVALQSLLQLFSWDEAEKLSPQGREYLERLQSVAAKTLGFTQFLKEMTRLQKHLVHLETFSVDSLVDDVRAEVQRQFPNQAWTWQTQWNSEQLRADRRLLHHGLVNLLRSTALARDLAKVNMQSAARPGQVDWTMALEWAAPPTAGAPTNEIAAIEAKLALSLAQQYFAAGDMDFRRLDSEHPAIVRYALSIPERSPHG